jgi:hypothetical protein
MRPVVKWIAGALLLAGGTTLFVACNQAKAQVGPNGGDVVAVPNTDAKAEVIGNPDTGEVVVRTWDEELARPEPLPAEPLVLGEGDHRLDLMPHRMADDPEGRSSRFYGRAEWLRGGKAERAWIECCGGERGREEFGWSHGWDAGRSRGEMWREMREHGEEMREHGMGMGMGMPPGAAPQGQPPMEHGREGAEMPQGQSPNPVGEMEHMPAGPMGIPPATPSPTPPSTGQKGNN